MDTKKILFLSVILILLLGVSLFLWKTRTINEGPITQQCVRHGPKGIHIHPHLEILIDGIPQKIPADIGVISISCMRPIHTHDDSGILHIESKMIQDFTLGDFFAIWNKTIHKSCIFEYCTGQGTLRMYVNGQENNEFENYIMRDKDEIKIEYIIKERSST